MSPLTVVKGDYFTALTLAGIIRCLRVHHPALSHSVGCSNNLLHSNSQGIKGRGGP
jgi:hypothetical protein